jgi:hypothetical protein
MTLRQMVMDVLTRNGEPMTYRQLTDAIWGAYPNHYQHLIGLYETEPQARRSERTRLGILVRDNPGVFAATVSEGVVLVGLAAGEADDVEDQDEDEEADAASATPAVYWYTFPAYQRANSPYPIKVGRGNNALSRIGQQVTAMPENPIVLGTFEHNDPQTLERALHCVLSLRGKKKLDAPGTEWFITTPEEIQSLISTILGT